MQTKLKLLIAAGGVALLIACGGGAISSLFTVKGTAALGAAIADGTVSARCAGGSVTSSTTKADGSFELAVSSNITYPCLLQVTNPSDPNLFYYSVLLADQSIANITPLSTLVIANALQQSPGSIFSTSDNLSTSVSDRLNSSNINYSVDNVTTALNNAMNIDIRGSNPINLAFSAATEYTNGDTLDAQIDKLGFQLNNANIPLSSLVTEFASYSTQATLQTAIQLFVTDKKIQINSLAGCAYAQNGQYIVGALGMGEFISVTLDFSSMDGTFYYKDGGTDATIPITLTQINALSGSPMPCYFKVEDTNNPANPYNMKFSPSGFFVISSATMPDPQDPPAIREIQNTSDMFIGVGIPYQPTLSVAELAGTWNSFKYAVNTSNGSATNKFGYANVASNGAVSFSQCGETTLKPVDIDLSVCTTPPPSDSLIERSNTSLHILTPNVKLFTLSDVRQATIAAFRAINNDLIAIQIYRSSSPSTNFDFSVHLRSNSPAQIPPAGITTSTYSWNTWFGGNGWNVGTNIGSSVTISSSPATLSTPKTSVFRTVSSTNLNHIGGPDTTQYIDYPRQGIGLTIENINASVEPPRTNYQNYRLLGYGWKVMAPGNNRFHGLTLFIKDIN